ncbi:MAG: membrane dipeptidase [Saprospiraceae bacterium]|nr:membrane dipeptidase [Saprospiraceae bacterium]
MPNHLTDIHCHVSFKPHYNFDYRPNINIWDPVPEDTALFNSLSGQIQTFVRDTIRNSQSNLLELKRGNIRTVFFVLHPMERGWLYRRRQSGQPVREALLRWVLDSANIPTLAASVSGLPKDRIVRMVGEEGGDVAINYYLNDTFHEYEFIRDSERQTGPGGLKFRLVSTYQQYRDVIDNHPDMIAVILTIEGGHALMQLERASLYRKNYQDLTAGELNYIRNKFRLNIRKIKGTNTYHGFDKAHTPFFITLAHFYNNFLCGHAKSYQEGEGAYPGMDTYLDQEQGMNGGITPMGREVIGLLLHKSAAERRVLIDVKHMSLAARQEYYALLDDFKQRLNINIPVIYSHGGVTGYSTNMWRGSDHNAHNSAAYLSHWSINLYDEDIRKIIESDGLIGLAPHEGRMPGGKALAEFQEWKQIIGFDDHRKQNAILGLRQSYMKMLLTNIYHIASVIGDASAYDHICLGSDYDGIMNPFDYYERSGDLKQMMDDLQSMMENPPATVVKYSFNRELTYDQNEQRALQFGLAPATIIEKIGQANVDSFMRKYFTSSYLGGPDFDRV